MALGLLAGASVLGSLFGASSARKAAKEQAAAAERADETNRYIYDNNVALTEPQRDAGQNALNALLYQYGLGDQPTIGGNAPYDIREINDVGATTQEPVYRQGGRDGGSLIGYRDVVGPGSIRYGVGEQTFDTRDGAQEYLDGLPRTGGTPFEQIALPDPNLDLSVNAFEASPGYQFRLEEGEKAIERAAAARGMNFSGATLKDIERFAQGTGSQEYGNFVGQQTDQFNRSYGAGMDSINALRSIAGLGESATQSQVSAGNAFATNSANNQYQIGQAGANGAIGVSNAVTGGINSLAGLYGQAQSGHLGQNPGFGIKPMFNPFAGAS